jgi:putative transposase
MDGPARGGMTSHVHMIIGSKLDKLDDIIRDMKKHTSSELKTAIKNHPQESRREWMLWMMERAGKKNGNNKDPIAIGWQFWQQHNKPLEIKSQEMFDEKLAYIHQNPVQAGFVTKEEDWKYSSARDFCGMKGLVSLSYS